LAFIALSPSSTEAEDAAATNSANAKTIAARIMPEEIPQLRRAGLLPNAEPIVFLKFFSMITLRKDAFMLTGHSIYSPPFCPTGPETVQSSGSLWQTGIHKKSPQACKKLPD